MELTTQSQPAETVHEKVLRAVADTRDVTPLELSTPLFHAIDPDCLDRLVESANADLSVTFEYHGCQVTVRGNRDVDVTEPLRTPERL